MKFLHLLTLPIFFLVFIFYCRAQSESASIGMAQETIDNYTDMWYEIVNKGNIELINSSNFNENITMVLDPQNVVGIEAFKNYYNQFLTGFSEIEFTISNAFGQGNNIAKHWRFKGKHTGNFFGISPTENFLDLAGVTLATIKDGKVIQEQDFFDNNIFLQQLGIYSNPNNISVINNLYSSFATGDIPAVLASMDSEIIWNEAENFPYADRNPYEGPEAILNGVFARIGEEWEYWKLNKIQLHNMDNNQVLATLRYDAKHKSTGNTIDAQTAHLWTLNDGKIIRFEQFTDTKQVSDAINAPK